MKKTALYLSLAVLMGSAIADPTPSAPEASPDAAAAKPATVRKLKLPPLSEKDAALLAKAAEKAQQKLKMTFTNIVPEHFAPGPLPGLFEMIVANRLIYYVPEKNWILFGEFFNSDGISETQRRLSELQMAKIKALPLDQAITVGNGPNEVIEFVDPDCPFCQQWAKYAATRQDLTRHIFIVPLDALHPVARAKAVHALCASDPGKTLEDFLFGRIGTNKLVACEDGKRRLKIHEGAARKLGVSGTPTLVINGTLVSGFNRARIATLLKSTKED